ncbi:MAG: nicotinamide riboside transporter PnuC [Opitutales bacterium]
MSPWEITGTVLGVIGVWLMIRQNIWGWPVGLVQVAVYAWVFYDAKLYSDTLLQIAFFLIQAYGWWHWLRGAHEAAHSTAPVTRLPAAALLGWVALGALATAGWGWFMHRTTDAALPWCGTPSSWSSASWRSGGRRGKTSRTGRRGSWSTPSPSASIGRRTCG